MKALTLCMGLALSCLSAAQRFPARPDSTYVADTAHLLSAADKQQIRSDALHMLNGHGAPVVVATIPSLAVEEASKLSIEQYARKLFDHWGIGSQRNNKGILLLVSKSDHKARIELGKAWRHQFDAQCSDIMSGTILPAFREGSYSQGITSGADALIQMTDGEGSGASSDVQQSSVAFGSPVQLDPYQVRGPMSPFGPGLFVLCPIIWFGFVVLIIVLAISRARTGGGLYRPGGFRQPGMFPRDPTVIVNQDINTNAGGFDAGSTGGGFDAGGGGGGFDGGSGGGGGSTGSW